MSTPWILAVDLGTGGPKTGAVTLDGELLAVAHRRRSDRVQHDGGAVQDPSAWWQGIREGVAEVLAKGVEPHDAVGVGITGQWGSTVPVGADGEPVAPCLLWSDTRGGALAARRLGGPLNIVGYSPGQPDELVAHDGRRSIAGRRRSRSDITCICATREPELYARIETLLEPLDYLGHALHRPARGDAGVDDPVLAHRQPSERARSVISRRCCGGRVATRRSFRSCCRPGACSAASRPSIAAELGLPAGLPVVAGIPDLHTGYIGSGAVAPYAGHMTISTTSWIGCEVPFKRTDVFHQIASVPGAAQRIVSGGQQSRDRGRLPAVAARRRGQRRTTSMRPAMPTMRGSPRLRHRCRRVRTVCCSRRG